MGKFALRLHINKAFSASWSFSRPSASPRVTALIVLATFIPLRIFCWLFLTVSKTFLHCQKVSFFTESFNFLPQSSRTSWIRWFSSGRTSKLGLRNVK